MAVVRSIVGFADFVSQLPLEDVAKRLTDEVFGGIPFRCNDDGDWKAGSCLRLEQDFFGVRVELGGDPNSGYTLEVGTVLDAIPALSGSTELQESADVSAMLNAQLARISGLSLTSPRYR
jgi:hypothetical protein